MNDAARMAERLNHRASMAEGIAQGLRGEAVELMDRQKSPAPVPTLDFEGAAGILVSRAIQTVTSCHEFNASIIGLANTTQAVQDVSKAALAREFGQHVLKDADLDIECSPGRGPYADRIRVRFTRYVVTREQMYDLLRVAHAKGVRAGGFEMMPRVEEEGPCELRKLAREVDVVASDWQGSIPYAVNKAIRAMADFLHRATAKQPDPAVGTNTAQAIAEGKRK